MTELDFDRVAQLWLRDGPTAISDRALQATLDEIHRTRQQRRLIVAGGLQMKLTWQLAGIAFAAILAVAAGSALIGREWASNGQAPTPTPIFSPDASLPRLLAPGTHTTAVFRPAITFEVPAGWSLTKDSSDLFGLTIEALNMDFWVRYDPVATTSGAIRRPEVGTDARSLADYLVAHPDLEALSSPTDWERGGLTGWWLDIHGDQIEVNVFGTGMAGSTQCVGAGRFQCPGENLFPDQRARVGLLDLPDGRTLLVWLTQRAGDGVIEPATRIIETFEFDIAGG